MTKINAKRFIKKEYINQINIIDNIVYAYEMERDTNNKPYYVGLLIRKGDGYGYKVCCKDVYSGRNGVKNEILRIMKEQNLYDYI